MNSVRAGSRFRKHLDEPHSKHSNRNAWLIFMVLGLILGLLTAFLSGSDDNVVYAIGAAIGGALGFLIGRSMDKYANKRDL